MPFLSDDDIDGRLVSPDNLVSRIKIHQTQKGLGNKEPVPYEIKQVIAELGNEDGASQGEIAKAFGISNSLVSQTVRGNNSIGHRHPELHEAVRKKIAVVNSKRAEAEEAAIDTVLVSLGLLGSKVSEVSKAKDIAAIAKDMSIVADKIRARGQGEKDRQVHLHLYAPKMKKVEDYEIIDV